MTYRNPGEIFLERHGRVDGPEDVLEYVSFLREEAGIDATPPVSIDAVFKHFGIQRKYSALPDIQGLLVSPEHGVVVINQDDPRARQRFTEAHELIEFLFSALPSGNGWAARRSGGFKSGPKEGLCNEWAAELLMPAETFRPEVQQRGVSMATAKHLARLYAVSLSAALRRAVELGPGEHAFVLWCMTLSKTETRNQNHPGQLPLLPDCAPEGPRPKLRVRWGHSTRGRWFIPEYKSVEFDTSVYRCYELGSETCGFDEVDLGTVAGRCYCESLPVTYDGERHVMSLIHLPGNEHSMAPAN